MAEDEDKRPSRLVPVLREGVAVIQMIFFKELRTHLQAAHPDKEQKLLSLLAGAITNELFGTANPEPPFARFLDEQRTVIEQEMLGLCVHLAHLRRHLTDALRIQALCDNQEGLQQSSGLIIADKLGMLLKDREIPLPSTFMTMARELGAQHQLIIPPAEISAAEDNTIVH